MAAQGHPFARPAGIALVTDTLVCSAALAAYNTKPGAGVSSLYIFKLGTSGYAVVNPVDTAGEWVMMHIYDARWVLKLSIGG